jgi:hypothetical protein
MTDEIRLGTRAFSANGWAGAFREQKYIYVDEQIKVLDHASGEVLSSFGHPGHQIGGLRMPTLWRSIPKAMFMWPRLTGAEESKDLSQ